MSNPRLFIVYTRTRGAHICEAYNRRHALAWTVALMAREFADFDPREVCAWCIAEKGERKEGGANA